MNWKNTARLLRLIALACTALAPSSMHGRNLLLNPGFEDGRPPWFTLAAPERPAWGDFAIAPAPDGSAGSCARLELSMPEKPTLAGVWGVVQQTEFPGSLPRVLRGRYFVEAWTRGTEKQYVQILVSLRTTRRQRSATIEEMPPANIPLQLAIVLCGATKPPLQLSNRKMEIHGPAEPELGRWIEFEFDLHASFERLWGVVPEGLAELRLFCEVRYDRRKDEETSGHAVVYFDDLFLGDKPSSPSASGKRPEGATRDKRKTRLPLSGSAPEQERAHRDTRSPKGATSLCDCNLATSVLQRQKGDLCGKAVVHPQSPYARWPGRKPQELSASILATQTVFCASLATKECTDDCWSPCPPAMQKVVPTERT